MPLFYYCIDFLKIYFVYVDLWFLWLEALSLWKIGIVLNQPSWDHAGRRHAIITASNYRAREVMDLHDSVHRLAFLHHCLLNIICDGGLAPRMRQSQPISQTLRWYSLLFLGYFFFLAYKFCHFLRALCYCSSWFNSHCWINWPSDEIQKHFGCRINSDNK